MEMKWYNIQLPDDLHRALKAAAANQALSLKDLIIQILREGLKQYV